MTLQKELKALIRKEIQNEKFDLISSTSQELVQFYFEKEIRQFIESEISEKMEAIKKSMDQMDKNNLMGLFLKSVDVQQFEMDLNKDGNDIRIDVNYNQDARFYIRQQLGKCKAFLFIVKEEV